MREKLGRGGWSRDTSCDEMNEVVEIEMGRLIDRKGGENREKDWIYLVTESV
jgi:hypothetical protein